MRVLKISDFYTVTSWLAGKPWKRETRPARIFKRDLLSGNLLGFDFFEFQVVVCRLDLDHNQPALLHTGDRSVPSPGMDTSDSGIDSSPVLSKREGDVRSFSSAAASSEAQIPVHGLSSRRTSSLIVTRDSVALLLDIFIPRPDVTAVISGSMLEGL